jgi:hypothetical protein
MSPPQLLPWLAAPGMPGGAAVAGQLAGAAAVSVRHGYGGRLPA